MFDFDGIEVMVDPYLSNSVAKVNPANYRRIDVNEKFFNIKPDVLILTHDHLDHTDPETLDKIFSRYDNICVLASENAWNRVCKYGGCSNYVMFNQGTVWTQNNIRFEAMPAEHSDDHTVGVLITFKGDSYYITGDTLYNKRVIESLTVKPKILFLPINGQGNNMNMQDAREFAEKSGAEKTVPIHFGMFDNIDPRCFDCPNKVVPEIYKEIEV